MDAIAVSCYGTVENHTKTEWAAMGRAASELTPVGLTPEDVAALVAWMKQDNYWRDRTISPMSLPGQVSKWRVAQAKGTSGQGGKVTQFLKDKYGEEDIIW